MCTVFLLQYGVECVSLLLTIKPAIADDVVCLLDAVLISVLRFKCVYALY